jgi:hypothetical protein
MKLIIKRVDLPEIDVNRWFWFEVMIGNHGYVGTDKNPLSAIAKLLRVLASAAVK